MASKYLAAAGNPGQYPTPNSAGFGANKHNPTNSVDQWNLSLQHQFTGDFTANIVLRRQCESASLLSLRRECSTSGTRPNQLASAIQHLRIYDKCIQSEQSEQHRVRGSTGASSEAILSWPAALLVPLPGVVPTTLVATMPWIRSLPYRDRAPEDSNRRLVFVASHVWEIPVGEGRAYLNKPGVVNVSSWWMAIIGNLDF